MCNVYSNEKRWRAGDWALTSGGGGSEEAPLSSVTSAAAAAAVAVAAAATTPPQPRRATPGPARRRRRVSTSPSCCCCCGRRCVSCCRRCPRCRRCLVASPSAVPGRRCRSSRYRTDDGYSPTIAPPPPPLRAQPEPAPAAAPQGALQGAARAPVGPPTAPADWMAGRLAGRLGPPTAPPGADPLPSAPRPLLPGRRSALRSWLRKRVHVTREGFEQGLVSRSSTPRPAHPHLGRGEGLRPPCDPQGRRAFSRIPGGEA